MIATCTERLSVEWGFDQTLHCGWVTVENTVAYDNVESPEECAAITFAIHVLQKFARDVIGPYVQLLRGRAVTAVLCLDPYRYDSEGNESPESPRYTR